PVPAGGVDRVRQRELPVVEAKRQRPVAAATVDTPLETGGRHVVSAAVEDLHRGDLERRELGAREEADVAAPPDTRLELRIELPAPGLHAPARLDRLELLGSRAVDDDGLRAVVRRATPPRPVRRPRSAVRIRGREPYPAE